MKKLSLFTLLIFSGAMYAQNVITTDPFSKITIQSNARVYVMNDSVYSFRIDGQNSRGDLPTVKNGALVVQGPFNDDLYVTSPDINEIVINGTGTVTSQQALNTRSMKLDILGDGKMDLALQVDRVEATVSGLGKITLRGNAMDTEFSIPGSGKIDAAGLKSNRSKVNISGVGKVLVDASDDLAVNISGSGTVNYKSPPANITKSISGFGQVKGGGDDGEITIGSIPDTTKLELGKSQIWFIGTKDKDSTKSKTNKSKPIWAGLELGVNSYLGSDASFDLKPGLDNWDLNLAKSISVGLNILQKDIQLGKSNVWLMTGLGITWNNYRFDKNVVLRNGSYIYADKDTSSNVRHLKSKLVTSYLTAPIMLQVFTSKDQKKAFHISAGAMLGLRLGSHTKNKVEIDGDVSKIKDHDDFNLSPFRYGFRVAVGYGKFNVFADYYASTMFRENKGPVLYPVNAGITLIGF